MPGTSKTVSVLRADPVLVNIVTEPILTEANIIAAKLMDAPGGFAVEVKFDESGSWTLEQYSAANPGKHFAIFGQWGDKLANGRWLAAPLITRRIANGMLVFTPDASREEAEQLVIGLNIAAKKIRQRKVEMNRPLLRRACAAMLFAAVTLSAQSPFQFPTANHALYEPGQELKFFAPTAPDKPWTSGSFGCVRNDGWQMHEGLDIRHLHTDRRGEPTDPVMATADGTVVYFNTKAGAVELRQLHRHPAHRRRAGNLFALRAFERSPPGIDSRQNGQGRRSHRHDGPHVQHQRTHRQGTRARPF